MSEWTVAQTGEWELLKNSIGHYCLFQVRDGQRGESLYFQLGSETEIIDAEIACAFDLETWLYYWAREYAHCFEQ